MKEIDIINPGAGKGLPLTFRDEHRLQYITTYPGDAEEYVARLCREEPDTLIHVYGGDGTVHEVINGIMAAGTGGQSRLCVHPAGTGNDFFRMLPTDRQEMQVDLIRYRTRQGDDWSDYRYSTNMINIGFDCDVVVATADMKKLPLVKGSLAYILAVVKVLFSKMGKRFDITVTHSDGSAEQLQKELLLTAIGNGGYCGGGFFAAPVASIDDGLLDVLFINKVSRLDFIRLVGYYRKGTHIDPTTGQPYERFKKVLRYLQCRQLRIGSIARICVDGQVEETPEIEISVAPLALTLHLS